MLSRSVVPRHPLRSRDRTSRTGAETRELTWDDVQPVDLIGLEVGYRLVPLVDKKQSGDSLPGCGACAASFPRTGFLVPAVHIRDNLDLAPNIYRINLGGVPVGESIVYPDRELAINPAACSARYRGSRPGSGVRHGRVWIDPAARDHAQTLGYTSSTRAR